MVRSRARRIAPWTACLALLLAAPAAATLVPVLTSEEVDMRAARIFEGRCVTAHVVGLPGFAFPVTEYAFEVERSLKGAELIDQGRDERGRFVVRQVGGLRSDGSSYWLVGLPPYTPGFRYRLALQPDSPIGLTSPVGFAQGVRLLGDAPVPAVAR